MNNTTITDIFILGATYLDFPANLLSARIPRDKIVHKPQVLRPPIVFPDIQGIKSAAELLVNAKNPLIIVGKGKSSKKLFLLLYTCSICYLLYL